MDINNSVFQGNGKTIINGVELKTPPSFLGSQIQVVENDKIYVNYREYKNGKWKVTIKSILKCLFC